ncbi:MAG: saccharopine dehydrogenase NADP-binding domain-containing protein [Terricaulis sp.]
MSQKEFDLIVYGASGFTGRLVAEYLLKVYGASGAVRWAVAGRDAEKLAAVMAGLGAPATLPALAANASDPASIEALAQRASVILTTVGPYQLYGEPLVAACARAGTDYVDLCGEPAWMAQMIARYEGAAKASGARIAFSCGFDSIPFDCGVFYLQQQAMERFGQPFSRVRGRVRTMKGGFSGGTLASMLATLEAGRRDPSIAKIMTNPYALVPTSPGVRQPRGDSVVHDEGIGWSTPFIMAAINTKNVHRSNALSNYRYGRDFNYDEMQLMGEGENGEKRAKAAANAMKMQMALLAFAPTRALLRRFALPKPGQGPSKEERESGSYEVLYVGDMGAGANDQRTLRAVVSGDKDPGYGSTSKMITEAALCLKDTPRATTPGGIWTPAAAMGEALIARLQEKAGLRFGLES